MLLKYHEGKGYNDTLLGAYEQLAELQREIKIIKLKELELQSRDVAVTENRNKRKKLLNNLLDQQHVFLAASLNCAPSKHKADDDASNSTVSSFNDADDNTDDDLIPNFLHGINMQRNGIPLIVDNSRSRVVQVDDDSTLNSSSKNKYLLLV